MGESREDSGCGDGPDRLPGHGGLCSFVGREVRFAGNGRQHRLPAGRAAGAPDPSRSRLSSRGGHHQVPAPRRGRPRPGRAPRVCRGDRRSGRCAAAQARPRRTAAGGRLAGDPRRRLCLRRRFRGGRPGGTGGGYGVRRGSVGHDDGGGVRKVSGEGGAGEIVPEM